MYGILEENKGVAMKEFGGFIELDKYNFPIIHENALRLNCARNCLAYLVEQRNIKNILLPKFLCDSVNNVCINSNINVSYYSVGIDFCPIDIQNEEYEWLYLVNYYGQITNEKIIEIAKKYPNLIVDNVQAYFQPPVQGIDTIYTCRKFFGVPDGAFLYTDIRNPEVERTIEQDVSLDRMRYLLGRFEKSGQEFYSDYVETEKTFVNSSVKRMSKLTENLLHGIDYENVKRIRQENFEELHRCLEKINELKISIPIGPYMYPLLLKNGMVIRKALQEEKIYIPTLWPNVLEECLTDSLEYRFAADILPIPVDQRYDKEDMRYLVEVIKRYVLSERT